MAHGKFRKDLHAEIKSKLQSLERFGESKHEAKIAGTASDGIYAVKTARAYHYECQKFAEYVKEHSPEGRYTSLEDSLSYAKDYLSLKAENGSSYTVKKAHAALAKLFGLTAKDFSDTRSRDILGETPERSREMITRGRHGTVISEKTGKVIKNTKTRAGRFSEKRHPEIVAFCRGTGLRRMELEAVRGDQLRVDGSSVYLDMEGSQCKGGRPRVVPVRDNVDLIVKLCRSAGSNRVFPEVPKHMDVHKYRGEYASAFYRAIARDPAIIPRNERYCCKGDRAGIWYDRSAMTTVSNALGHNRVSIIAGNYLFVEGIANEMVKE